MGSGPFTYQWSNGATTEDISNLTPGVYSVLVSNSIGCETTRQFVVTAPSSPTIPTIIFPANCDTPFVLPVTPIDSILLCGATWEPINIDSIGNGTYELIITYCNGCTHTSFFAISNPAPMSLSFTRVEPTPGASDGAITVEISGGSPPYQYEWGNGSTLSTISGLPAGIYSVTVTDAKGCVRFGSVTIGDPLGILYMEGFTGFKVKPNPFREQFELNFNISKTANINISVIDVAGRNMGVLVERNNFSAGKYSYNMDTSAWAKGIYFLEVEIEGQKGLWKMVKQ